MRFEGQRAIARGGGWGHGFMGFTERGERTKEIEIWKGSNHESKIRSSEVADGGKVTRVRMMTTREARSSGRRSSGRVEEPCDCDTQRRQGGWKTN